MIAQAGFDSAPDREPKQATGPGVALTGTETPNAPETATADETTFKNDPAVTDTREAARAAAPSGEAPSADPEPPVFGSPRALDRLLAQTGVAERGTKRAAPDDAATRAPVAPTAIDRSAAQSRAGADLGAGDASATATISSQPSVNAATSREGDAGAQQESRQDVRAGAKAPVRPPSKPSPDAAHEQAAPGADPPESPNKGSVLAPASAEHAPRLSLNAAAAATGPRIGATDRQEAQDRFTAAVARGLTAAVQQKGGSITLSMQPESLGSLRIRLDLNQGAVSARFEAATPEAHDLLTRSLDALRASLEAKGLSAERLHVEPLSVSAGQGGPAGHGQDGAGSRPHAQRANGFAHDAADGRSRGAFDQRPDGGPDREQRGGAEAQAAMQTPEGFDSWLRLGLDATA